MWGALGGQKDVGGQGVLRDWGGPEGLVSIRTSMGGASEFGELYKAQRGLTGAGGGTEDEEGL